MDWIHLADHRWSGIWGTPNVAACGLLQIICCIPILIQKEEIKWRFLGSLLLAGFCIGILTFLLVLTGSRGGIVGLVFILVGWSTWCVYRPHYRRPLAFCAVVLISSMAFAYFGSHRSLDRMSIMLDHGSGIMRNRIELWKAAAAIVSINPFVGTRHFGEIFHAWYADGSMYNSFWPLTINDLMQCAIDYGLLTVILIVYCLWFLFSSSVWIGLSDKKSGVFFYSSAMSIVVFVVCGFFSNMYIWGNVLFVLLVALTVSGISIKKHYWKMWEFYLPPTLVSICLLSLILTVGLLQSVQVDRFDNIWSAHPRHEISGRVAIIGTDDITKDELSHYVGKPMIELGWSVDVVSGRGCLDSAEAEVLCGDKDAFIIFYGVKNPECITDGWLPFLKAKAPTKGIVIVNPPPGMDQIGLDRKTLLVGQNGPFAGNNSFERIVTPWSMTWPRRMPNMAKRISVWMMQSIVSRDD